MESWIIVKVKSLPLSKVAFISVGLIIIEIIILSLIFPWWC